MPLSAPPPTWATVLGKPTTISGFGITDALTVAVNSLTAGNGLAVSAGTGAVTISASAPAINTVGSYVMGCITGGGTYGTNYAAGISSAQIQSGAANENGGYTTPNFLGLNYQNNLSGTWRWISAFGQFGLAVRIA